MKNIFAFTADALTVNGHTFPAEYVVHEDKSVTIFVTLDADDADKDAVISVSADDPRHAAIIAAVSGESAPTEEPEQNAAEQTAGIPAGYQAVVTNTGNVVVAERHIDLNDNEIQDAAEVQDAAEEKPARNPKQERGAVPEKSFIGTRLDGAGYSIFFNGEAQRTQIRFAADADSRMIEAAKAAGFYYSPTSGTYNKKLTFKAYRAAVALAEQFNAA